MYISLPGSKRKPLNHEERKIAKRLHDAKYRCGREPSYKHIEFLIPDIAAAARELYARLGPIPPGHSIDRINTCGPYAVYNLRWASIAVQNANRRSQDWER